MPLAAESGELTKSSLLARDVLLYHLTEDLTGLLVYFMVVFSPWAFGTTQPWSIWTMRSSGYCAGFLLLIKLAIRSAKGYRAARWGEEERQAEHGKMGTRKAGATARVQMAERQVASGAWLNHKAVTQILAVLTLLILAYCLVGALNACATFNPASAAFEYHACARWLPHSFDSQSTWDVFWSYLALACSFWALRDWLFGRSTDERRASIVKPASRGNRLVVLVAARLRRLLLVLSVSGGLLGLEGILQRISSCPKLLFLVKPEIHQTAETQFASFAYRANGAQYFNLLWPVCLGLWWMTRRSERSGSIGKHLPLVCAGIMAACPLLASARGAALVDFGMVLAMTAALLLSVVFDAHKTRSDKARFAVLLVLYFAGVLALGLILGWPQLRPRMAKFQVDLREREQLYEHARRMARDYPGFGTGPGTFDRVFQLYRSSADDYWPAQLHNDWLETRLTFGWIGSGLIALAGLAVGSRWFVPGGICASGPFVFSIWLSLAGCLVQARWDFPLQVYSILFLFLVWCAVLFTLSRR